MLWNYNDNNELMDSGELSYSYDENGNTVQKIQGGQSTYYIYNVENRLVEVQDSEHNSLANYYYDPFGRRLFKEVDGVRTYYFYSDQGLIGEYDSAGNEIQSYVFNPKGRLAQQSPAFEKGKQPLFLCL